ncbi:polymorphic toxin-type HINT domain-containing protein [Streptomyces sp. KMM 9044]|uniref:polymorphic toxin-type HINT domain-containing protein n=1 Tax=Streptomyces sp. KMM 9044 TaxID=2744474 RepID=UPI002151FDAF|nr:polymorphic toxin-type HINT domain-containing protein [Streptomyces sp. KMM 9044]WAX80208.1 polymorphic toxin-type HINT domain-containing protein [Streptomyces sp. KMM 9044]
MADGTRKPIENVKLGDKVLATDPKTGETTTQPVVSTVLGDGAKNLVRVTIRTRDAAPGDTAAATSADGQGGGEIPVDTGTGTVVATGGHPFWVPALGEWVDASELDPGQWLQSSAGDRLQITAVQAWTQNAAVHNLTVSDTHTYYVLAGATPVLVHNIGGGPVTDDFNRARNQALTWLSSRGFKAEKVTLGKFGTIKGKPIGRQTANGKVGFRIEFDDRHGAHINVWAGKEKGPHFQFNATESAVTKLQGLHGCG